MQPLADLTLASVRFRMRRQLPFLAQRERNTPDDLYEKQAPVGKFRHGR